MTHNVYPRATVELELASILTRMGTPPALMKLSTKESVYGAMASRAPTATRAWIVEADHLCLTLIHGSVYRPANMDNKRHPAGNLLRQLQLIGYVNAASFAERRSAGSDPRQQCGP